MHSPRRRTLLLCAAALLLGYYADAILRRVVSFSGIGCGSSIPYLDRVCGSNIAAVGGLHRIVDVVVLAILLVALRFAIVRWALRPVRDLAAVVDRVGPQNLGYRLRADGRSDELRALSDALDEMMDRIAAGYEGQRRFAANASHELRTPLAVQRTLIEVGMADSLTPEQLTLLTRQLLDTNERNERLIEGLLVLSETDQGLLTRAAVRLDEVVRDVLAAHADMAVTAGVRVQADLQPCEVLGERVLLERLVANLVQNALKYNRPGGDVALVVGSTPAAGQPTALRAASLLDAYRLVVRNTGAVVPAEAVPGLFEPFRRLSGDRINHDGGAGLGLTIARSTVQAHDGYIAARPGTPDGLEVTVELPRAAPPRG